MDGKVINISVAQDFSITPGPRYRDEGDFSGQEFRESIIVPAYDIARKQGEKLVINLDGTIGYGTSFLEEVFGGLARAYSTDEVLETLVIVSNEEPYLLDDITGYINDAKK